MNAEILCIGTELLIGQIVNTNASWLAQELAAIGVDCLWQTTVGDNMGRMREALETANGRADLVIITGGLGPTPDDMTVEAIAQHLGEPLAERPEARAHLEAMFAARGRQLTPSNYKQVLFPPSAELIPNPAGTAMGLAVWRGRGGLMAFPGVPYEMKPMWRDWAGPRIAAMTGATIRSVLLKYIGIGEAALAEQVAAHLARANPSVAPYASNGEVHLRVTAKAADAAAAEQLLAPVVAELSGLEPYYGRDEETLPGVVIRLLADRGQTLAVAESASGGLLASRLTDIPGASRVFKGGVVCYAGEVKTDLLGVPEALIAREGAVSQAVTERLAAGAMEALGADWGVGITGWASGGPGVPDEDVGLVYFAVAGPDGTVHSGSRRCGPRSARETTKHWATQSALDLLRLSMLTRP